MDVTTIYPNISVSMECKVFLLDFTQLYLNLGELTIQDSIVVTFDARVCDATTNVLPVCVCVCVCMYVCMYVFMYVCMYGCMYVCMYVCM